MQPDDGDPQVVWARVDQNFYVANVPGAFLGCIDRTSPDEFHAYDAHTQTIGSFPTLTAAMTAVVDRTTETTAA